MEKELYFTDPAYEAKTKTDLEASREALQKLVDVWNSLDLKPCDDLFQLVTQPEKYYSKIVHETTEVPESFGRYALKKDVFVSLLDIPVPDQLYRAAREARKQPFIGLPSLWSISDGKTVVMDANEAETIVKAHCIYVENDEQKKFVEAVKAYQEASNYLHEVITGSTGKRVEFMVPFSITGRALPIISQVKVETDVLRQVLKLL